MLPTVATTDFRTRPGIAAATDIERLSLIEKGLLFVGINEIMLQFDKYLMFHERDSELGAVGGFVVSVMSVALAVLYWIWFSKTAAQRQTVWKSRVVWCPPMMVYLLAVALSSLSAVLPVLSYSELFLIGQGYLLFFYLANRTKHSDDVVFLVGCVASALLVQALLNIGLRMFGSAGEVSKLYHDMVGQLYEFGPLSLTVWEGGRTAGTMKSAVLAGSTMAMLWLPTAALALSTGVSKWWKAVATVATLCGLLGILFTQTRGAVVTVILGSGIIFLGLYLRQWLPRWAIPMAVIVSIVGIYPLIQLVQLRVSEGDEGSAESRIHLTAIAMEMLSQRPIAGYGAGNCHLAGERFANQAKYRSLWYYTIHCKYLVVWIETGLLGLLSYLAILFTSLRYGWLAWQAKDPLLSTLGLALTAAIIGTMVHMSVDIFNSRIQTHLFWAVLGITAAVWKLSQEKLMKPRRAGMSYGG